MGQFRMVPKEPHEISGYFGDARQSVPKDATVEVLHYGTLHVSLATGKIIRKHAPDWIGSCAIYQDPMKGKA